MSPGAGMNAFAISPAFILVPGPYLTGQFTIIAQPPSALFGQRVR
jgi:hypothetical protein